MSQTIDQPSGAAGQRPVFLTVLCILSFVGAGFGILGYVGAMSLMGAAESLKAGVEAKAAEMGATVTSGPSTTIIWAYIIIGFLTVIISLVGVLQMWKLKKSGYMIYVAATVISIIMAVVYGGFSGALYPIVFGAAFIIMYGANLKAMR